MPKTKPESKEPKPQSPTEALKKIRATLERRISKGIVRALDSACQPVDVIPTGIVSFDKALHVGGIPRGRVTELYGPPGAGKSTACMHAISEAQKLADPMCLYADFEHTFDPRYAKTIGVDFDPEKFQLSQPDTLEHGMEVIDNFLKNARDLKLSMIVIDSIAAMAPKAEVEGEKVTKTMPGLHSRLISQFLKARTCLIDKTNVALVGVNQIRNKIGVMGSSETTTGGNALKHYATVRMEVRRVELIKPTKALEATGAAPSSQVGFDDESVTVRALGAKIRVHIVKSKVGNPFRAAIAKLYFGKGFDRVGDFFAVGMANNVFTTGKKEMTWALNGPTSVFEISFKNESEFRGIFTKRPELTGLAYRHLMDANVDLEIDPVDDPDVAPAAVPDTKVDE